MVASAKITVDGLIVWYQIFAFHEPHYHVRFSEQCWWETRSDREERPRTRSARWLGYGEFLKFSFRVARPISDVYDFPSGCYSWEISKYHPNWIISLFSVIPCFSLNSTRNAPRRTAASALRTTSGRTYHKYLKFSGSECLVLRLFEATTVMYLSSKIVLAVIRLTWSDNAKRRVGVAFGRYSYSQNNDFQEKVLGLLTVTAADILNALQITVHGMSSATIRPRHYLANKQCPCKY